MSPIGVGGWAPEARYWVCGFEACDGFETISRGRGIHTYLWFHISLFHIFHIQSFLATGDTGSRATAVARFGPSLHVLLAERADAVGSLSRVGSGVMAF